MKKSLFYLGALALAIGSVACTDDDDLNEQVKPTPKPEELSEEWYAGGVLGTSFNSTSSAFEQSTPVVDNDATLAERFLSGEGFFEDIFVERSAEPNAQRQGLGPLYLRNSCIACHPGYGHGRRQDRYRGNDFGNGYLLVITDQNDNFLSSVTGMPQTKAVYPFKAPIDETKINIEWRQYTDEWGNRFPDGESYDLTYPEVTIPEDAFYVPLEVGGKPISYGQVKVRLESTIGIYGTGLLDAIPDEAIKAEYLKQEKAGVEHNPAIWANGGFTSLYHDKWVKRYTYGLTRGPLQDGPGSNAIWNITNVTRSDRRYHYMTETYARVASQDPDVQKHFYQYFPERKTDAGVEKDIYNYLMAKDLPAEMSDDEFTDLMVWHRGLAVPAARNLDDPKVQRGKQLFTEMGCATCHRPSWTTGDDEYEDPNGFFEKGSNVLPRYPHQKIWPYTDLIQHRMHMKNDIRTGWCRTTPMWGRGLSTKCTGAGERLHDCRARTVIEAIMWHGDPESDARWATEKFRQLSKDDRDAVVEFIESI